MSTDLTTLDARVRAALGDPQGLIYDAAALEAALLSALSALNTAGATSEQPRPYTVAGLDGAAETSLPDELVELLVRGAAAQAALSRAMGRSEGYSPTLAVPAAQLAWARAEQAAFEAGVDELRRASLQRAAQPPWSLPGGWKDFDR